MRTQHTVWKAQHHATQPCINIIRAVRATQHIRHTRAATMSAPAAPREQFRLGSRGLRSRAITLSYQSHHSSAEPLRRRSVGLGVNSREWSSLSSGDHSWRSESGTCRHVHRPSAQQQVAPRAPPTLSKYRHDRIRRGARGGGASRACAPPETTIGVTCA